MDRNHGDLLKRKRVHHDESYHNNPKLNKRDVYTKPEDTTTTSSSKEFYASHQEENEFNGGLTPPSDSDDDSTSTGTEIAAADALLSLFTVSDD